MASGDEISPEKRPTSFEEVLERAKREGNHRVLAPGEMFGGPEGYAKFRENMRKVHDDYVRMANASAASAHNKILRGTIACANNY